MIFAGIDQSLTGTGVAIIENDSHSLKLVSPKKLRGIQRLLYIENTLKTLLPDNIDLIAMEGYAFSAIGHVFALGELGGIIKRFLYVNNYKFIIVPPGTLKKYVSGKGNSPKNLMLLSAYKKWGIEFKNDNLCDAFSLAKLAKDLYTDTSKKFNEIRKAVIKYNPEAESWLKTIKP